MKKLLLVLLIVTMITPALASWKWSDSVLDTIEENNNPNDYCPEASEENQEEYCIEVSGWDQVSLENNQEGLDNILTIYRETSSGDGDLNNDEIDMILSLYTCYQESIDTVAECIDEKNIETHPEEKLQLSDFPDIDEDSNENNEEDSDKEDEGDDNSEDSDELVERIYYEENGEEHVSVSEDGGEDYYGMHDGAVDGEFKVEGSISSFNLRLEIRNEQNDQFLQNPIDMMLSTDAPSSSLGHLEEGECNEFDVVADDSDDDEIMEADLYFIPNSDETGNLDGCPDESSDDEEEDSGDEKNSGGYEFSLKPKAEDISSSTDVRLDVENNDGSMDGKKIRLALNGIRGPNNDPYTTYDCTDSSCYGLITSDRIEGTPNEVVAKVGPGGFSSEAKVTWKTE